MTSFGISYYDYSSYAKKNPMKIGPKVSSIGKDTAVILLITILIFSSMEGFASFMLFFSKLRNAQIVAERLHTEYDPLLGWINKRNIYIQDMYGPNMYLSTNSQRFRNNYDFDINIPDGKRRWICSGDSFTLGYGVDNDHTWCSLLSSIVPDTETVNMGQGGYGLDQAYLWYMRDGVQLQHDVVIFAFISEDIYRMAVNRLENYPKPRLYVQNGQIIKQNVPVPQPGLLDKYLPRYKPIIAQLCLMQIKDRLLKKIKGNASEIESVSAPLQPKQLMELTSSIFSSLYSFNEKSDRTVLLIHLPTQLDYNDSQTLNSLRSFCHSQAEATGWFYIDLIDEFRSLNSEAVSELFIQKDIPGFMGSAGHYTEKGNRYIARLIVEKISGNSSIAKLLSPSK